MKILGICSQCMVEKVQIQMFLVDYYEDKISYVTCTHGHTSAILIQKQKFEILMDSGSSALAEGFTLEAAASFSAALERFYEFCIKVFLLHRKIEKSVSDSTFDQMSRQSERQLGAFLALYALEFSETYIPNKKITTMRNAVIHKGSIPTPDEARNFCEMVYAEIYAIFKKIKSIYSEAIQTLVMSDIQSRTKIIGDGIKIATVAGYGIFNIASADQEPIFSKAFSTYLKSKEILHSSIAILTTPISFDN